MLLLEEVGVNKDVVKLADYVVNKIIKKGKVPGDYEFLKKEIENIPIELPINKLKVTYNPGTEENKLMTVGGRTGVRGFFNPKDSKRFKSGNTELEITLTDLRKTLVYHELNHALQFIKLGRHRTVENYTLNIYADLLSKKFKSPQIQGFAHLIYYCAETELNSKVIEFYAHVKGLMKVQLKKTELPEKFDEKQLEKNIERFKKEFFRNSLKVEEAYNISKFCENYDISKYFEKCDKEEENLYFSLLHSMMELKRHGGAINDQNMHKYGFLMQYMGNKLPGKYQAPKLNPQDLREDMDYYQSYINKQGGKLKAKLLKTWFLIDNNITIKDIPRK